MLRQCIGFGTHAISFALARACAVVVLVAYLLGRPRWLELITTDDRGAWLTANTGYLRLVALAVVVFLVIGFVVSWPLAIFLAAVAGLVELTIQALREPRETPTSALAPTD